MALYCHFAERIKKNMEECEFVAQIQAYALTVSPCWVANCPKYINGEGLIRKADAAIYRAKEISEDQRIKVAV